MSSSTPKYGIPYAQQSDPVAQLPITMQAMAARLDLLQGEGGQFNIASLAAGTTLGTAITLSRTYPGNASAVSPAIEGHVTAWMRATLTAGNDFNWWVNNWLGTATTITGFTLNVQFVNAQTNRVINWRFIPVL